MARIRIRVKVKFRAFGVTLGTVDVPFAVKLDGGMHPTVEKDAPEEYYLTGWHYSNLGRGVEVWWRIG